MKNKKQVLTIISLLSILLILSGCGKGNTVATSEKEIIRIGHNQSQNHPTHLGMLAFEEYIESQLGDKYDVQLYPSELLGSQTNMVQLTQTGAIEMVVASNSILETFDKKYEIFNLPYLFESKEIYHAVMNDPKIVDPIFKSTKKSGFETVAWLDAGIRNFYTIDKPVVTPDDLSGLKIRVQQSPTNVMMMKLFNGSATPMGFGDVYTAIQSGVIDGAENNELALTENGHGDVVNYYSYTKHQMIPDEVIVNNKFLENLSEKERKIFNKGFKILEDTQHDTWSDSVKAAKEKAENEMGVEFNYPDTKPFREKVQPLHEKFLKENPSLQPIYDDIMQKSEKLEVGGTE
uniref:TRAP transporter substrate-binding protein n=1 Tax=Carnobacterium sp. TaxID=48221 RepID=UPI00344C2731